MGILSFRDVGGFNIWDKCGSLRVRHRSMIVLTAHALRREEILSCLMNGKGTTIMWLSVADERQFANAGPPTIPHAESFGDPKRNHQMFCGKFWKPGSLHNDCAQYSAIHEKFRVVQASGMIQGHDHSLTMGSWAFWVTHTVHDIRECLGFRV